MTTTTTRTGTRNRTGSLVLLCAAMFLVLLDVSIVNVALPDIARGLGGGTAGAQSVVDSYTVPLAALLLTAGVIADRYGARNLFIAGLFGFGAGSVGCAVAPQLAVLVAGRIVQGVGAAAMLPASLALIAAIWTDSGERARAIAIWSGVSGSAVAIGPLVGGALVAAGGWRLIFVVNLPVVVVAAYGARVLPIGRGASRRIDWRGAACSSISLACLVAAVIELGRSGFSALGILLVAGAVTGLVVFVVEERRADEPMVPRALWCNGPLLRASAGSFGMNLVGNGSLLMLAFLLQFVQGRTPFAAGLWTLPMFAPLTLVPLVLRRWMVRMPPDRLIRGAFAIGVVGELALAAAVWRAPHSALALVPGMLAGGVALGLLVTPLVASSVAAAPAYSGVVGGLNNAARQTGTSMGVAIFGALAGPVGAATAANRMAWCFVVGAGIWLLAAWLATGGPRR